MLNQFIGERSHSNAIYVTNILPKKPNWQCMLQQFMKEIIHYKNYNLKNIYYLPDPTTNSKNTIPNVHKFFDQVLKVLFLYLLVRQNQSDWLQKIKIFRNYLFDPGSKINYMFEKLLLQLFSGYEFRTEIANNVGKFKSLLPLSYL